MMFPIPDATLDEWLTDLKKYQRDQIRLLLRSNTPEEAAKLWLSAEGPVVTRVFGGTTARQDFYDRFAEEFRKLVCGDSAYRDFNQQLAAQGNITREALLSAIAAYLGNQVGAPGTLLAPVLVILLSGVGLVGRNAWCAQASDAGTEQEQNAQKPDIPP